jgi:hypothetical protein
MAAPPHKRQSIKLSDMTVESKRRLLRTDRH